MSAKRDIARRLTRLHAHAGFEPLPVRINQTNQSSGSLADVSRQTRQIIEGPDSVSRTWYCRSVSKRAASFSGIGAALMASLLSESVRCVMSVAPYLILAVREFPGET